MSTKIFIEPEHGKRKISCSSASSSFCLLYARPKKRVAIDSATGKAATSRLEVEEVDQEERQIIGRMLGATRNLRPVREIAKGIQYLVPLYTGWKPPLSIRNTPESERRLILHRHGITVKSDGIPSPPPPVTKFEDLRLPKPIKEVLKIKGIVQPTPIQMQALPVALSGRDLVGVSSTGSGKTLVYVLPLILTALQEELALPIVPNEGPFGLVLCPSRELAKQIHGVVKQFIVSMRDHGYPGLRSILCIGGSHLQSQLQAVKKGVHIAVATPGRLKALLLTKAINLDNCRFLALDEADRLVDSVFEDETRLIFDHFKAQRQTLLFSATMPAKIQYMATTSLVKPVTVITGLPGGANCNVVQKVKYVKQDEKMVKLVKYLGKTAPPVMIFAMNKNDVDNIHQYLLLKGVDAAAIHGDKDQSERDGTISSFRDGHKDVLVATDVVSKGLDFPNIQHVINYDLPADIDNYVHRVGRTGRCGKKGLATTFINRFQSKTTLLDLKHLLLEARQQIPSILLTIDDSLEDNDAVDRARGAKGCQVCGGLGHRLHDCPKLGCQHSRALKRADFRCGEY